MIQPYKLCFLNDIVCLSPRILDPRACTLSSASTAAITAPMICVTQLTSVYALYYQMNQTANNPKQSFGDFVSAHFRVLLGYSQVAHNCVVHVSHGRTVPVSALAYTAV